MLTPVVAGRSCTAAWRDRHTAVEHGHFSAVDRRHQMNLVHVTEVPNSEQLASHFGQTTTE